MNKKDAESAGVIFRLLKLATSREVVADFLKSNGIAISAKNWEELYSLRIFPALEAEKITLEDLRDLLRNTEESGRQHVFLYQCDPDRAKLIMNPQRVQKVVAEMGLSDLMTKPLDLELPAAPQIVDIRGVSLQNGVPAALIVKRVETRKTQKLQGEVLDEEKNTLSRTYYFEKKRAVSLAKLHADGLLEIRIARQDNSSQYKDNIHALFLALTPLLPTGEFKEISLANAKGKLVKDQEKLKGEIRFVYSEAKNDTGNKMMVSTASQEEDIFDDAGSKNGLNLFLKEGGRIDRTNTYFIIPGAKEDENKEIHVILSGEVNEFAIPPSCTAADYDYVCGKVRELNR